MNSNGRIIALSGTHGTGKTTLVYELAAELKRSNKFSNVCVITESTRKCPLPVNHETTPKSQAWVYCNQMMREIEAAHSVGDKGIVLTDRCVIDPIVYSAVKDFDIKFLIEGIKYHIYTYRKIYCLRFSSIYPEMKKTSVQDDGFRVTDNDFQKNVDETFRDILLFLEIFIPRFRNFVCQIKTINEREALIDSILESL